ncbi:ATP-binding protein [Nocardioides sp.]|uniref:ATP-binding protein n=1 Tax=Nocardioides sp. TaxID=35761 RepID=UPI003D13B2BF
MSSALDRIVGVYAGRSGNPREILKELAWGPYADRSCHPPADDFGRPWLRLTALPKHDPQKAGALERGLAAFAGVPRELRVRIGQSASGETSVHLTAADEPTIEQSRRMLTPFYRVQVEDRPPALVGPKGAGVIFRLQADQLQLDYNQRVPGSLLERLAAIRGPWSVDLHLRGLRQYELMDTREHAGEIAEQASSQVTASLQLSAVESVTQVSSEWQRIVNWMSLIQGHLTECGSQGGWAVSTWATAPNDETLNRVLGALHGGVHDRQGRQFWAHDLDFEQTAPPPISLLSTRDVAGLLQSPPVSTPGLLVQDSPPPHRRPDTSSAPITLGTYSGTDLDARIGIADLEGHAFVTGTTGSGKSTTLHRLITDAWNQHSVPFLIVDPVKDDYADMAGLVRGGIGQLSGRALSLNLLSAWPGEDQVEHIARVAQAFKGSFVMPSPTPYVVTQLFDRLTELPDQGSGSSLFDVRGLLKDTVEDLGYAAEARLNIEASLRTRLNLLLAPSRAHRFCWPESDLVTNLFSQPTVVTLADIPDDEERSFIVLVLALATWANAKHHRGGNAVRHLLVLEEAHRVLPELGPSDAAGEGGTAQRVSAELLAAMLAEVRSYGQQVIVVDQSPAKVSSEVIRNTNLKICHRITHPDDQELMAGALGMDEAEQGSLGSLARGEAVISTRTQPTPQTVSVDPAVQTFDAGLHDLNAGPTPWPCGCELPAEHFKAWNAQDRAAQVMALPVVGLHSSGGLSTHLRSRSLDALNALASEVGARTQCLAWSGIRKVVVTQAQLNEARGGSLDDRLTTLFNAWSNDATQASGTALGGYRAVARSAFPADQYPLTQLRSNHWEDDLLDVINWAKEQLLDLSRLIDAVVAREVLRAAVREAVEDARLPSGVAEGIARRSGMVSAEP